MERAGTLTDYLYQKDVQVGEKINLLSTSVAAISESDSESSISVTEEEEAEYDSSSDDEMCAGECFVEEESGLGNQQVTRDVNFLLGATSRFGRPIRFNSRFVS